MDRSQSIILVTGGAGFISAPKLAAKDATVRRLIEAEVFCLNETRIDSAFVRSCR